MKKGTTALAVGLHMKKFVGFVCVVFVICGCSTAHKKTSPSQSSDSAKIDILRPSASPLKPDQSSKNFEQSTKQPPAVKKGIVFGKTEFRGVLKTDYVELFLSDSVKIDHKYRLHLGDGLDDRMHKEDSHTTYFSMELPEGKYVISKISIPVGTTKAVEDINVIFDVVADKVIYVGTLKAIGTKETVKFGGVPVIKPGFDYTYEILDERSEALPVFFKRYPKLQTSVGVQLMQ